MNTIFTCAQCGSKFRLTIVPEQKPQREGLFKRLSRQTEFETSKRWEPALTQASTVPPPAGERLDWREAPAGTPTVSGHFAVPALQTLGTTFAFAIGAAAVGLAIMMQTWPAAIRWWIGATGSILVVSWFLLLFDTRKLLRIFESFAKIDLGPDGTVGQPKPSKPSISIAVTQGRRITYDDLPADEEILEELAEALLIRHVSFSRRALAKATSFSQDYVTELQEAMRVAGYARHKGGKANAGTELTRKGEALLREVLS